MTASLLTLTFVSQGSKLPLREATLIAYLFCLDIPIYEMQKFLPTVAHTTLCRKVKQLRELLVTTLTVPKMSDQVQSKCEIVEIDESVFGKKQKYNRGKRTKKLGFSVWLKGRQEKLFFMWWPIGKTRLCFPSSRTMLILRLRFFTTIGRDIDTSKD